MSEGEGSTPDDEVRAKGNIFQIVDDLIGHMHTTRSLFIILIVASFIAAPAAIILGAMLLSPPPFVKTDAVKFEALQNGISGPDSKPGFDQKMVTVAPADNVGGYAISTGNENAPAGKVPGVAIGNFTSLDNTKFPPGSRFIFVAGGVGAPAQYPVDLTSMVITFVAISVILAALMMFIGIKEYRFFSRWNRRYHEFTSLQDLIMKKLQEEKD